MSEVKNWSIRYSHSDGRAGTIRATTEISKSGAFSYGNGKSGALFVDGYTNLYDLRYNTADDLHMEMIKDYFGKGLVSATEV